MRFQAQFLASLLAAAAIPSAADDLTIVARTNKDGGSPMITTSYLTSDHVRMGEGEEEAIFEVKTGQMTFLDAKKKEYYVITKQDVEQFKARIQQQVNNPQMVQAREKMKNLPPDMQQKLGALMGGITGSLDVRKSGTTRKIAGYTCENWTITFGQISKTEECLTTELQFPGQAWATYREYADSMKSMATAFGPMGNAMTQMQEKFKDLKGFPLASTTTMTLFGRPSNRSSEVTEVKHGPISPSVWEVPAGYRRVDSPMLKGLPSK